MPVADFVKVCENVFFQSIEKRTISSVLTLGDLFLIAQKKPRDEQTRHANQKINKIIKKLSQSQISLLVDAAVKVKPAHFKIMNIGSQKSLLAFKKHFPLQSNVYQNITMDQMFALVHDISSLRAIQLSIIRKHLFEMKQSDPFKAHFSFDLLMSVDSLRNGLYVSSFVKQCKSLPIKQILRLGRLSVDYARAIVEDLGTHIDSFTIIVGFLKHFPELRKEYHRLWQERLASLPWSHSDRVVIDNQAKDIASQYPEFGKLVNTQRTKRSSIKSPTISVNQTVKFPHSFKFQSVRNFMTASLTICLAIFYKGGSAAKAGQVAHGLGQSLMPMLCNPIPVFNPARLAVILNSAIWPVALFTGISFGATYIISRHMDSQNVKVKLPPASNPKWEMAQSIEKHCNKFR